MNWEGDEHLEGNMNCDACWSGWPRRHECGGLMHSSFGDENANGDYWLVYKCDRCGESDGDLEMAGDSQ